MKCSSEAIDSNGAARNGGKIQHPQNILNIRLFARCFQDFAAI